MPLSSTLANYFLPWCLCSTVEVFLVDIGRVAIVDVSQICAAIPPQLMKIPQQALQCALAGVDQLVR